MSMSFIPTDERLIDIMEESKPNPTPGPIYPVEDVDFVEAMKEEGVQQLTPEQYEKIIKALNKQINTNVKQANKKVKARAKRKAAKKHQRINRRK